MSFGAEMKDFISAFNTTSQIGDRLRKRWDTRQPGRGDLDPIEDPFKDPAKVTTAPEKKKPDDKTTKDGDVLTGGEGSDTLIGSAGTDSVDPNAAEKLRRRAGIKSIESGGNYQALGPVTHNGDRAYGAYQIMGNNIPSWTKAATGTAMTPQEFLKNPKAQDATFDHQFDGYVQHFGLEGAAQAWLGGPGSVGKGGRKDQLGTSVSSYGKRFMDAYKGGGGQDTGGAIADDQFQQDGGDQLAAVIPDQQDQQPIQIPDTSQSDSGGGDSSGAPLIEINPVDLALGEAPQVPGFSALYAEEGGVIPHFANAGIVEPSYNTARGYTQPVTSGGQGYYDNPSKFQPRQIAYKAPPVADYSGPTSSQKKFADLNKQAPVVEPKPPTAPTTPKKYSFDTNMLNNLPNRIAPLYRTQAKGIMDAYNQANPNGDDPVAFMRAQDQINSILSRGAQGYWGGGQNGGGGGYTTSGRGWEEGGVIPDPSEPGQSFAKGGVVRTSETPTGKVGREEFDKMVEAAGGGQQGRDIVAMRLARAEGRPGSSAYRPADDGYFKPKKAKPKVTKVKGGADDLTSSTDGGDGGGGTPHVIHPPNPKVGTDKPVIPPNTPRETVQPEVTTEKADRVGASTWLLPGTAQEKAPQVNDAETVVPEPSRAQTVQPIQPNVAPNVTHVGVETAQPVQPETVTPESTTESASPVVPESAWPIDDYQSAFDNAHIQLQRGGDPRQIGDELASKGIPTTMWPKDILQSYINSPDQPAFAKGGVIPEETGNHPNTYTTSRSYYPPSGDQGDQQNDGTAEDQQKEDLVPTPKLMTDVGNAIHQGLSFLTQHFQGGGDGAIPEAGGGGQNGAVRFAQDEGAATPEEISGVDSKIDPGGTMREGDKQMTRLAKMTTWYLDQNRPKDAAAAAGSLLMYGARRFGRLGSMAQAAFSSYQQSGDPKDLQNTLDILSQAYQMIPDGMNIQLSSDGKSLVGMRTNADGDEEQFDIDPSDIPNMIRQAQDKSGYWQQIFRLADPETYRQNQSWDHQERVDKYKYDRERKDKAADRQASSDTEFERWKKQQEYEAEHPKPGKQTEADKNTPDWATVNPLLAKVQKMTKPEEGADEATVQTWNDAVSRLYDALPAGADRAKLLSGWGIEAPDWKYVAPSAPVAGNDAGNDQITEPPAGNQPAQPAIKEGSTATGPGGKKIVFHNGQWVPMNGSAATP